MQVRKKDIRDLSYVTDVFFEGCPCFFTGCHKAGSLSVCSPSGGLPGLSDHYFFYTGVAGSECFYDDVETGSR